jgi:hypothetical protein
LLVTWSASTARAEFTFDDIEFWVGTGTNRAAFVIDWFEDSTEPPALAWGYRWDGTAKGRDMLMAIVAADPRLFARLGGTLANPVAVYGLGYDADDDGNFGIDSGTPFDSQGFAFSDPPDFAEATDPDDFYGEGWFTAFWHYGVEEPIGSNPYDGGSWRDIGVGMASRDLVDGSWDSWVFSPTFDFASFAMNPHAAPSPFPPGDFNQDGHVDADDYGTWTSAFGSTFQPAVDANQNGVVDAADYVIWREYLGAQATAASAISNAQVPEPTSVSILLGILLSVQFAIPRQPRMNADGRRLKKSYLRSSVSICGFFPAT